MEYDATAMHSTSRWRDHSHDLKILTELLARPLYDQYLLYSHIEKIIIFSYGEPLDHASGCDCAGHYINISCLRNGCRRFASLVNTHHPEKISFS